MDDNYPNFYTSIGNNRIPIPPGQEDDFYMNDRFPADQQSRSRAYSWEAAFDENMGYGLLDDYNNHAMYLNSHGNNANMMNPYVNQYLQGNVAGVGPSHAGSSMNPNMPGFSYEGHYPHGSSLAAAAAAGHMAGFGQQQPFTAGQGHSNDGSSGAAASSAASGSGKGDVPVGKRGRDATLPGSESMHEGLKSGDSEAVDHALQMQQHQALATKHAGGNYSDLDNSHYEFISTFLDGYGEGHPALGGESMLAHGGPMGMSGANGMYLGQAGEPGHADMYISGPGGMYDMNFLQQQQQQQRSQYGMMNDFSPSIYSGNSSGTSSGSGGAASAGSGLDSSSSSSVGSSGSIGANANLMNNMHGGFYGFMNMNMGMMSGIYPVPGNYDVNLNSQMWPHGGSSSGKAGMSAANMNMLQQMNRAGMNPMNPHAYDPTGMHGMLTPNMHSGVHSMHPFANANTKVGVYTRAERQERIQRFRTKKANRIWKRQIKYDCRKRLADTRPRVKGRFVSSTDDSEAANNLNLLGSDVDHSGNGDEYSNRLGSINGMDNSSSGSNSLGNMFVNQFADSYQHAVSSSIADNGSDSAPISPAQSIAETKLQMQRSINNSRGFPQNSVHVSTETDGKEDDLVIESVSSPISSSTHALLAAAQSGNESLADGSNAVASAPPLLNNAAASAPSASTSITTEQFLFALTNPVVPSAAANSAGLPK